MADALAYLEDTEIAPADVIRACIRRLGEPGRRYLQPWDMVQAIDAANDNKAASDIHRRLYQPLSNFIVQSWTLRPSRTASGHRPRHCSQRRRSSYAQGNRR